MGVLTRAVEAISVAGTGPYALIAYLSAITAWALIAWRVQRNRRLLAHLSQLPAKDRLAALRQEMAGAPVRNGLSAEQYLRSRVHLHYVHNREVALEIGPPPPVTDPQLRQALEYLSEDIVATMTSSLASSNGQERERAARRLGFLGFSGRSATRRLEQVADDAEPPVRSAATAALQKIRAARPPAPMPAATRRPTLLPTQRPGSDPVRRTRVP